MDEKNRKANKAQVPNIAFSLSWKKMLQNIRICTQNIAKQDKKTRQNLKEMN